jgi:uncharacterized protein (TIGR03118 family)
MRHFLRLMFFGGLGVLVSSSARGGEYVQTNIVSDLPGVALNQDTNLVNPWGMSFSSTSPFWVSNQGSGTATLYNPLASPVKQGLTVTIPTARIGPPTGPTGQVFNSTTSDFMIPAPGGTTVKSTFLFDTLDGTIQGWNPGSNAGLHAAEPLVTANAVFTGLTLASSGGANYLYAANAAGSIMVYDKTFNNVTSTTFAGKFVDPNPVAGFTPYNIQRLSDDNIYVTYAAATKTGAPLPGGYVDEYDTAGNFIRRIATNGPINAAWGLAIAPSNFGTFSGDLLIGNLLDSKINAYNLSPTVPQLVGSITVDTGFTSQVGLWALAFGNGVTGDMDTLYFTAGINDQKDGLFGSISFVPEPSSGLLLILGGLIVGACQAARHRLKTRETT